MAKDSKILLGILGVTLIVVVVLAVIVGGKVKDVDSIPNTEVLGLAATPEFYDLGNVKLRGGIVTKEYEIKNETGKNIRLRKIATSCMCTTAKVSVGDKETRFFGMEMDRSNAPVNLEIRSGEVAKVTINFDPAAHGPEGVGPFDRSVWLSFSDPGGIKELKFSGTVVAQ
jgi:hypothetical protein